MNMRIRILACLCILSILVSLIALSQAVKDVEHDPEYTEYDRGIAATTGVYFMENWNKKGRLYLLNNTGDVLYMTDSGELSMDQIHSIEIANDKVYAIYSVDHEYIKDIYHIYRIAEYDPSLVLLRTTDLFTIDSDEDVTSIDVDSDTLYVSTVGSLGSTVNVYSIPQEEMIELDGSSSVFQQDLDELLELEKIARLQSIVYRESEGGQFFCDAYFNGTDVEILKDTDTPTGEFAPDLRVKSAVDLMHFNLAQQIALYSNYVLWWCAGLIIWFILMGLVYACLRRRNRSLYTFVLTELLFLIITAAAFLFVRERYLNAETIQNGRYAVLAMKQEIDYLPDLSDMDISGKDFYQSEEYRTLTSGIRRYISSGYNDTVFYDIFVMRIRSGKIMLGARGYTGYSASFVYGGELTALQQSLKNYDKLATSTFYMGNRRMAASGMHDDDPASDYALVSICYANSDFTRFWSDVTSVFVLFIIVFLIGSILIGIIFYLQSLDLAAFEHAIRDVALGRTKIYPPETPAQDMKSMWNSLAEICKRMEEINYEKFRIFEAYYRFAPKNIETIMGKDSIFDVENGDITAVKGTLMLLSSTARGGVEKKVKSLRNIMSYMDQFSENQEGILVTQDSSLSVLEFLFLEDYQQTVARATQFLHRNSSDPEASFVSGLLYDDTFVYGVAGITTQSRSFLTSPHSKELEAYAVWFTSLNIPLVITETVAGKEDPGQTRYIGFVILSSDGRRVNLYEVIDAESARLRQLKLMTRDKFEETLKLFYSKEYYLARNQFTEILKECPEDELAKWYVFESERYLNGEMGSASEGELHISE